MTRSRSAHDLFERRMFMTTTVSTPKELGAAIKRRESEIVITGRLGDAVLVIQATGPVAWGVTIVALGAAVAGIAATVGTGGAGAPAGVVMEAAAAPVLIGTLGSISVSSAAIGIALAGGGVGTLSTLRKYTAKKNFGEVHLIRR